MLWFLVFVPLGKAKPFQVLAWRSCRIMSEFDPQEVANTAWAFAKAAAVDLPLFNEVSKTVMKKAALLNPQESSNII